MTQQEELLRALIVERYQPRHLASSDEEMPPVMSFDDFIASLYQEARKPVPTAKPVRVKVEASTAHMNRIIADRDEKLGALGSKMPSRIKKTPPLSRVGKVEVALAQGASLHDALQNLRRKK